MPSVRVRGVDIYYEEHGSPADPHLLVAHGLMASVALLPSFAERIDDWAARGLHVVAYDARGHGRSGFTTRRADYTWRALAEDMHGVILALGLGRTSIYGGSMGAGTALMLALDHADAVDKLILMAPPPFGDDVKHAARLFGPLSVLYQLLGPRLTARVIMATPFGKQAQRENPALDLHAFFASQRRAAIVPAIRGLLHSKPPLPAGRFGEIHQPALILTRPGDPIHPLAAGDLLYQAMPHARLAVAPTATYWQENADALTHVVTAFVKGETIARGLPDKAHPPHA